MEIAMAQSGDKLKPPTIEPTRRRRRRKIPLACEPCRERKSRCDGAKPICSGCTRRSLKLEDCVYTLDNARTASNDDYIKILHDRIRQLEKACSSIGLDGPAIAGDNDGSSLPQSHDAGTSSDGNCSNTSIPEPIDPQISYPVHNSTMLTVLPSQPQHSVSKPSPRSSISHHTPQGGNAWKPPITSTGCGPSPSHGSDGVPRQSPRDMKPSPADSSGVNAMGVISADDAIVGGSPAAGNASRDFYGSSSAASFIREALGTFNKNSPGNNNSTLMPPFISEPAGERKQPGFAQATNFALPPRHLADHLVEVYFRRIYYLYPFFYRPAFEKAYKALWEPSAAEQDATDYSGVGLGGSPEEGPNSIVFYIALNGIFALGCYSSDLPPEERISGAQTFFERTKTQVGIGFLEQNNLGAIQALLITALFLQSTPYPSRCWNSVGVACRLAQGLGLHADMNVPDGKHTLEREMRIRTWYGCVNLDMLVSMTFGRPTMTTFVSNLPLPSTADDAAYEYTDGGPLLYPQGVAPTRMQFFVESIRLSTVLEQILLRVYQPWKSKTGGTGAGDQHHFSLDTVLELDAQQVQFEKSVPWPLSWLAGMSPGVLPQEQAGCMRMQRIVLQSRFLYLRLMLFRPVLSQLATNSDRSKPVETTSPSSNRGSALSSSFGVECGKSCAQAAVDLIAITHASYLNDESGAWWWSGLYASTAGGVLIVALACPSVCMAMDQGQIKQAWIQCQDILTQLSGVSVSCQKSLRLLQAIYELSCNSNSAQHQQPQPQPSLAGADQYPGPDNMVPIPPPPMPMAMDGMAGADMFGLMDMDMMNTALMSWDPDLGFSDFLNGM